MTPPRLIGVCSKGHAWTKVESLEGGECPVEGCGSQLIVYGLASPPSPPKPDHHRPVG